MSPEAADLGEYVRQLEHALDTVWGWMPIAEAKEIQAEQPDVSDLCLLVHTKLHHPEISENGGPT